MEPKPDVDAYRRPSKMRIGLAVAWLIVSLAVGGAVGAQPAPDSVATLAEGSIAGR
jgi:hypothetical protein